MPGNENSGPRKRYLLRELDPLPEELRMPIEDVIPPQSLNVWGRKWFLAAAAELAKHDQLCRGFLIGLEHLAYEYQSILKRQRAGLSVPASHYGCFRSFLRQFCLPDPFERNRR